MHHAHAINRIKSIRHFRVDSCLPLLCRRKTFIRLSFAFLLPKQNVFILSRSDFYGLHNIFASNDLHNKKIFLVPQYFIVSQHNFKNKKKTHKRFRNTLQRGIAKYYQNISNVNQ